MEEEEGQEAEAQEEEDEGALQVNKMWSSVDCRGEKQVSKMSCVDLTVLIVMTIVPTL